VSTILYNAGIPPLPAKFEAEIKKALDSVGVPSITVSSTFRTPDRQALAMYDNLKKFGVSAERKLYGPAGNRVIDTYELKKNYGYGISDTLAAMTNTIRFVGCGNVSAHCTSDPEKSVTLDIEPSSIDTVRRPLFESAMKAISSKFLIPGVTTGEPVYHAELKAGNFFFELIAAAGLFATAVYYITHKKEAGLWLKKAVKKIP
jgi:hypothetical protein